MKKFLSIILTILMIVTMLPMAVMPASAAYEYDDATKLSFKITNLVREWKGETKELGESGSAFYEQSLTKVADGKYKYTYKAALGTSGGTWWSDPKTVTFDGVDCESDYYKTFEFTESTHAGGYTMTWTYTLEVKRYKGHTYGAWSDNGDGTHTRTCSINPTHIETGVHNWVAATCVKAKHCKTCGLNDGEPAADAHKWVAATCTAPETCKNCGTTQGEPVADAHSWNAVTCVLPQTCKYCGGTQGEALGHNMVAATFGKPAACSRCGATDINISVLETALINTNVNLPSKAVKDDNAGYNDITWSVVDAGSTGATINGKILKAYYSGEAVIRATIESGSKDFTVLFQTSENIDISLGSVTVSQKDDSTLTVAYIGFEGGSKDFMVGEPIQITGTTTSNCVQVSSGSATVILNNVSISRYGYCFRVNSGATADLTLVGNNAFSNTSTYNAALSVPDNATVIIGGEGTLTATLKSTSAAIGSGSDDSGTGTIVINGGTIIAKNTHTGFGGAGIGGANENNGGNITINGGNVTAIGGNNAAGIGGGYKGNGGTVVITGGNIKAIAGKWNKEAIGKGLYAESSGTIKDGNGNDVSLNTITLNGASADTAVTATDGITYGLTDVKTLDTNKLYFYLPADTVATSITAGGNEYICNSNLTYYTAHNWANNDGICANGCGTECAHENETGDTCSVCGVTLHTCDFSGEWKYDADKHWKECAVDDCDKISEEVEHSYTDGKCACGYTCPHNSYTDGVCDKCDYECPHEWGEGVLTRPVHDAVLGSKDGYYTYTCTVCGKEKKETVKSADYSAYEAASEEINGLLQSDELTNAAKQAIYSAANECGLLSNDLMESEQNKVDGLVAELEKILADAEEKIASGEYVKIDGLEEIVKINDELNEQLTEKYGEEALEELTDKIGDKYDEKFNELYEKAEALTGSVAENKEALEEIKAEMEAIFAEIEKCLAGTHSYVYVETAPAKCEANAVETGTCALCGAVDEREVEGTALQHIFLDYASNGDATCTADGTKTAECANGCGTTDTVADEGSQLDHNDEDGDKICDGCQTEIGDTCPDCGGKAHSDSLIGNIICWFIMLINLIKSMF